MFCVQAKHFSKLKFAINLFVKWSSSMRSGTAENTTPDLWREGVLITNQFKAVRKRGLFVLPVLIRFHAQCFALKSQESKVWPTCPIGLHWVIQLFLPRIRSETAGREENDKWLIWENTASFGVHHCAGVMVTDRHVSTFILVLFSLLKQVILSRSKC